MKNKNTLKGLMAAYGLTMKDLADIAGIGYQTVRSKIQGHTDWKRSEMLNIVNYFRELGEDCTLQSIFGHQDQGTENKV